MTQSTTTGPLDELESILEAAITNLEETESELSELSEWTEDAKRRLVDMSAHDRDAVSQQASDLESELRIVDEPTELIEFGEKLKDSFAKPVEQSALQGLEDVIEILDLDLPQDRVTELRKTVKNRTSSDLQNDAQNYKRAISILEAEPALTVSVVAADIEKDETRYLVGPSRELLPLIKNIHQRRKKLEDIEDVFRSAGEWVPANLTSVSKIEYHYKDLNDSLSVGDIEDEINVIDNGIADIDVSVDVTSIVQSDIKTRFEGLPLTEYQSELNEVSKRITKFSTSVQEELLMIRDITTLESIPDSLTESVEALSDKSSKFYASEYSSLQNLLGAAKTVEDQYEKLLEQVMDELKLLENMHEQISKSEELTGMTPPSIETSPSELDLQTVRKDLDTVFQVIIAYREWINTAFEQLSDEFSGEEVGKLFERLYTEGDVSLSSVNLDALQELQDTVPIVVSLQQ